MKGEERAHRDAHFQEELESLKASVARLTSLLEQTLKNTFGEGPSNRSAIFVQPPTTTQPEEIGGKQGQEPQHNLKGNCTTIAEWSLFLFCQKITTSVRSCLQKLLDFFVSTYSSFCR